MNVIHYSNTEFFHNVDSKFPTSVSIPNGTTIEVSEGDTAFGYTSAGTALVKIGSSEHCIAVGMYFSIPGPAVIQGLFGYVSTRIGYKGMFVIGGPTEKLGRLCYIDGCSDTLVFSPPVKGDPCLNYLYVPPNIDQTEHTHPSVRVGYIIDGSGYCLSGGKRIPLEPGYIFILPTDEPHSFHTQHSPLQIFIYHPDSDFGPTHEEHPMINRTMVNDVSLSGNNKYRTIDIKENV